MMSTQMAPMSGGKTSEEIYKKVKYKNGQSGYEIIMDLNPETEWTNFNVDPVLISKKDFPKFDLMERTVIASAFINADFVINACKWKTHFLTRFTGAVKNYWGVQVGTTKSKSHLFGPTPAKFAIVLTELYQYIHEVLKKDNFVIMDAIQAMHGSGGPSFGNMIDLNLILASQDSVALDTVAVNIGGLNAINAIDVIRECHVRGLGIGNLSQIEILGENIEQVRQKTTISFPGRTFTSFLGVFQPIGNSVNNAFKRIPRVRKTKCLKCGQCKIICPTDSILEDINGFPKINRTTCINCLCCAEGCPHNAINTPRAGISGFLGII